MNDMVFNDLLAREAKEAMEETDDSEEVTEHCEEDEEMAMAMVESQMIHEQHTASQRQEEDMLDKAIALSVVSVPSSSGACASTDTVYIAGAPLHQQDVDPKPSVPPSQQDVASGSHPSCAPALVPQAEATGSPPPFTARQPAQLSGIRSGTKRNRTASFGDGIELNQRRLTRDCNFPDIHGNFVQPPKHRDTTRQTHFLQEFGEAPARQPADDTGLDRHRLRRSPRNTFLKPAETAWIKKHATKDADGFTDDSVNAARSSL